jgi:hypothetical protein
MIPIFIWFVFGKELSRVEFSKNSSTTLDRNSRFHVTHGATKWNSIQISKFAAIDMKSHQGTSFLWFSDLVPFLIPKPIKDRPSRISEGKGKKSLRDNPLEKCRVMKKRPEALSGLSRL